MEGGRGRRRGRGEESEGWRGAEKGEEGGEKKEVGERERRGCV